jgi:hypothetical protein
MYAPTMMRLGSMTSTYEAFDAELHHTFKLVDLFADVSRCVCSPRNVNIIVLKLEFYTFSFVSTSVSSLGWLVAATSC